MPVFSPFFQLDFPPFFVTLFLARRDHLREIEVRVQRKWEEEKIYERQVITLPNRSVYDSVCS